MSIGQTEETFLRDDLHQLSVGFEGFNFNVRKYKAQHEKQTKRKSLPTHTPVRTQPIQSSQLQEKFMYRTHLHDKGRKSMKQNNFFKLAAGMKKKHIRHKTSVQKDSFMEESFQKTQYKTMQKKYNKGPLNKIALENWLDSILLESLQIQILDDSLQFIALKKFQIDSNTLAGRGLRNEQIQRIYRSLFVYSLGYNNFLKETIKSDSIVKNVWKVYSVLLEYCAEGKYQTLIGGLERQKNLQLNEMQRELNRKQEIIEKNQELNEQKNVQIFKEIRHLKQENVNLKNQKNILYNDFQKTDQAFNQEVALRLLFQNKINELFGIYRQLLTKHQWLYEDYKTKLIQWKQITKKYNQLSIQHKKITIQHRELVLNLQHEKTLNKFHKEEIETLNKNKDKMNEQKNLIHHQYEEERRTLKEKMRKISQFEIQIANLKQMLKNKQKSWHQVQSQYQLSLLENKKLYSTVNEQRTKIQSFLFDKKQVNNRIMSIVSDASFQKNKKQEYYHLYINSEEKLARQMNENQELRLNIKILEERNQSFRNDHENFRENIKKMHDRNFVLQEQLKYLREFQKNLTPFIEQKNKQTQMYKKKNEELLRDCQELKQLLKRSQLRYKVHKAQIEHEIENYRHTIEKYRQEKGELEKDDERKTNSLNSYEIQIDRLRETIRNAMLSFKNEKFQRDQLKQNHNQLLVVFQKKSQYEKELLIQISELKEKIFEKTRQASKIQFQYQMLKSLSSNKINQLKEKVQKLERISANKGSYINPMIFQDLAQNFRKKSAKYEMKNKQVNRKETEIRKLTQSHLNQIESMKHQYEEKIQQKENEYDSEIFKITNQRQYQRNKAINLQKRLQQLEDLAETYTKLIQQKKSSEKQLLYASIIEEKTNLIDEITKKLSTEISNNTLLQQRIISKEREYDSIVFSLKDQIRKQKQKSQDALQKMKFELQYMKNKVLELKSELQDYELNLQIKIHEKTSVSQKKDEKKEITQRRTLSNWSKLEKVEKSNPSIQKRNQMARKFKNAVTYYKS